MRLRWKIISFGLIGGGSTLIHFAVFNFFRFFLNFNFVISLILAVGISLIFNFTMNRNITFSAKKNPIRIQLPKHLVVYVISIGANFLVTIIARFFIGEGVLQENIALITGLCVSVPISFLGSLFWTFKE